MVRGLRLLPLEQSLEMEAAPVGRGVFAAAAGVLARRFRIPEEQEDGETKINEKEERRGGCWHRSRRTQMGR